MLQLRDYQREALDQLYAYWANGGGNGLIVLPTGAGKALVIAKLIEELLADYPDMRILNVTHSSPLVGQNYQEFLGLSPFAPAGIYSAGLNRRDARAQVLFCGIQSVWNKVDQIGDVDLVIVDEAHAISRNANTQYGKFFKAVRQRNPDSRTCGTTATDYRMDSGRLTDDLDDDVPIDPTTGEPLAGAPVKFKLFDDVVYEIGIGELIEQGYLTRLTSQKTTSKIDLKGVGTRGGEYIPGQVSAAAERIIEEAIAEDMVLSEGRRAGLFFSTSKENAAHVAEAIRRHGKTCAVLTSDNSHETDKIFRAFRAGEVWAISSVSMITTGTNFPFVDFISLILSTKSPGKLVQILGRGTRNSPGKTDCLIADHGKNLAYHGPIDQIRPREPGKGLGEQPKKQCPQDQMDMNGNCGCGELIPISIMTCQCCGYIFPPNEEEKITAQADTVPVLSTEKPWSPVTSRTFRHHPGKEGKPDSVKVTYMLGMKAVNEWFMPAHSGYAKSKTDRAWIEMGGNRPFPKTVIEFLGRQHELMDTTEIQLSYTREPKYPDIVARRYAPENDNMPAAANDNKKSYAEIGR
ncbi:DEAD/DEAH box helicase [Rhizobium leguminosarum]|uniref:DEAD/DEAH box helicase n=1 Tax=Rhizobium leguminosarum TaxID=384 RepID=UPI0015DA70C7|nr:DEAD/DEAH box helicase [Rhizobium leguminosarum]NZD50513.1 DEAD/DEAH box helicase [Rhizobium leguminosarum]